MAVLSDHAKRRAQQRGIPLAVVRLLLAYGQKKRVAGGMCLYFGPKSRRRLARKLGRAYAKLEKHLSVYAILDGKRDTVITVGHRYARIHEYADNAKRGVCPMR